MDAITRSFEANASRPFLVSTANETLSYSDVMQRCAGIAAELHDIGIERGDRLCVSAPNSVDLALLYLGALASGVVLVPLGTGFGRRELRSVITRVQPDLIIGVGDNAAGPQRIAEETGIAFRDELLAGVLDAGPPAWPGADDLVAIHFTSGTTGPPRGVGHRLSDFVGNSERYTQATGIDADSRFYATLPMTYMAGYYNLLLLPLVIGASVVIDSGFDARVLMRYWRTAAESHANTLWLVPTILAMLLEIDRGDEGAEFCREYVRFAACGTAPLDPDLRDRFEERYGVRVHDSYGLSETLLATASTPEQPTPRGAVGSVLPGVDVRIGDGGAVQIATPDMFAGYFRVIEDGHPAFDLDLVDGAYLDTGDIGELEDGVLRITGRAKDVIIRGGVNVSPLEIEKALEGESGVRRVAVVGVPHRLLGEEIAAVVSLDDGTTLEAVEPTLKARAREQLQPTQQPGTYLQIDSLPTTPTGKIRRGALRDLVIDRLGLPAVAKGFARDDNGGSGPRIVDLSHPLREGMTTFPSPNHPPFELTQLANHAEQARETRRIVIGTHTGTHVDAPSHMLEGGSSIETFGLDTFTGPAAIADLTPVYPGHEIGVERLKEALGGRLAEPRVLLRFDWSRRFDDAEAFYADWPYLSGEACEWLVDQGVRLVGMDTPSPDDPANGFGAERDSPNHKILLGAGVVLLEYLANLDQLGSARVHLIALPLSLPGADGAPVRAVAVVDG